MLSRSFSFLLTLLVISVTVNQCLSDEVPVTAADGKTDLNNNSTLLNSTIKGNSTAAVPEKSEYHERGILDTITHGFESLACKVGINSACEKDMPPPAAIAKSGETGDHGKSESVVMNSTTPTPTSS